MFFSNFIRTESDNQILFKNSTPIENVGSLKFYKDDSSGSFSKKEFRWSFNRNYWASWEILNQGNLTNTDIRGNLCLYIEVRYLKINNNSKVNSFSVNYTESKTIIPPLISDTPPQSELVSCSDIKDSCNTSSNIESEQNCTLLDGKPGSYYLWRPNHKGSQPISTITGLQSILNNLNIGIQNSVSEGYNIAGSGIGVFYEKINQTLLFKRIDSNNGISIIDSSGIITLSIDSSLVTKDPSLNELYFLISQLSDNLNDISIYIDTKFTFIDSSLNDLKNYIDSSLLLRVPYSGALNDVSLNFKNLTQVNSIKFNPSTYINEPYKLGWDLEEETLTLGLPDGGSAQLGKEVFDFFTNLSGTTLVDGDVVSVITATGNRLAVTLTDPKFI